MTEPQRLRHGGSDLESALLRSAEGDAPSSRAVEKTVAALGIGTALATAAAASAATTLPPAAPAVTVAAQGGVAAVVKWVGIASFSALALWGTAEVVGQDELEVDPATLAPAAAAIDEGMQQLPALQTPSEQPEPEAKTEAASEAAAQSPAVAGKPAAPEADATLREETLRDEVAALDAARKAVSDDPQRALEAIEQYREKFKDGALGHEAEVLRIEALARAGKTQQAHDLAREFLAEHPSSPFAKRVRSVLVSASRQ